MRKICDILKIICSQLLPFIICLCYDAFIWIHSRPCWFSLFIVWGAPRPFFAQKKIVDELSWNVIRKVDKNNVSDIAPSVYWISAVFSCLNGDNFKKLLIAFVMATSRVPPFCFRQWQWKFSRDFFQILIWFLRNWMESERFVANLHYRYEYQWS